MCNLLVCVFYHLLFPYFKLNSISCLLKNHKIKLFFATLLVGRPIAKSVWLLPKHVLLWGDVPSAFCFLLPLFYITLGTYPPCNQQTKNSQQSRQDKYLILNNLNWYTLNFYLIFTCWFCWSMSIGACKLHVDQDYLIDFYQPFQLVFRVPES